MGTRQWWQCGVRGGVVKGGEGASSAMVLFLDPGIHYVSGP